MQSNSIKLQSHEKIRPPAPVLARILLITIIILLYAPIVVMMTNAFIEPTGDLGLHWFREIVKDNTMIESLGRTLFIAAVSSASAVFLSLAGTIAMNRSHFKFKKSLARLSIIGIAIPELVFALSLMTFFSVANAPFGITTIIIAHITFILSFVVFTLNSRFETLDKTLDDAARDLGATAWQTLFRITIPLLKPALVAGFILGFLLSFDDFLVTYFNAGAGTDTLPIKLYSSMRFGLTPKLSALATIMFVMSCLLVIVTVKVNRRSD